MRCLTVLYSPRKRRSNYYISSGVDPSGLTCIATTSAIAFWESTEKPQLIYCSCQTDKMVRASTVAV